MRGFLSGRLVLAFAASATVLLAAALPAEAETRTPSTWPFAASSPWNSSIGSGALFQDSACNASIPSQTQTPLPPWIDTTGLPIYQATSTDPPTRIYASTTPGTPTPHGTYMGTYNVPAGASPGKGDLDMVVTEPGGNFSDEMFDTHPFGAFINVYDLGRHDLVNGDGFKPVLGWGPRATDASYLGGLIRTWELQAGSIRHALALTLTAAGLAKTAVKPANGTDSDTTGNTGNIPYGELLAIPSTTSIDSLGLTSSAGRTIATALQTYGGYAVDRGSEFTLSADTAATNLVSPARTVTNGTSDLIKIAGALRCVSNNSGPNWGGGGTPLAPPPPPFG